MPTTIITGTMRVFETQEGAEVIRSTSPAHAYANQ